MMFISLNYVCFLFENIKIEFESITNIEMHSPYSSVITTNNDSKLQILCKENSIFDLLKSRWQEARSKRDNNIIITNEKNGNYVRLLNTNYDVNSPSFVVAHETQHPKIEDILGSSDINSSTLSFLSKSDYDFITRSAKIVQFPNCNFISFFVFFFFWTFFFF